VGEAGHEAAAHGIGNLQHDDGDGRGRLPGGLGRTGHVRHDDIYSEPDQFRRERGQLVIFALGRSPLDGDVLALDVAELAQPLPEGLRCILRGRIEGQQDPDPRHLRRPLRISGEWRREDGKSKRHHKSDGREPHGDFLL
jgi:hypothetical protein